MHSPHEHPSVRHIGKSKDHATGMCGSRSGDRSAVRMQGVRDYQPSSRSSECSLGNAPAMQLHASLSNLVRGKPVIIAASVPLVLTVPICCKVPTLGLLPLAFAFTPRHTCSCTFACSKQAFNALHSIPLRVLHLFYKLTSAYRKPPWRMQKLGASA